MRSSPTDHPGVAARGIALAMLLLVVIESPAQTKVTGKISGGFQAPTSMDERGRRHVLKGTSAEPRGNNVYELTEPRVTSFNAEDNPEMFIEAPRCLYSMQENTASSDSSLSVRTTDGRFSIAGSGWRWDPSAASLVISNNVVAHVQKSALATNLTTTPGTNAPVKITSGIFRQEGEKASFIGSVVVEDGPDRLTCDRMDILFVKPGGLQKIEAIQNVVLTQKETTVKSGRAVYDLTQNELRISEQPRWMSEQRDGSADLLVLNRNENTLIAEGNVYMKLPLTNVAANMSTGSSANPSGSAAPTNRFLEVSSGKFRFQEATSNRMAQAVYQENVRVVHSDATITAMMLTVDFNASNRVQRITADQSVRVESEGSEAFGERAEYNMESEKITLSGNPHWKLDESTGRSEQLVFFPKTKEILALKQVEMTLPGQSVGGLFAVNLRTNQPARSSSTNAPMTIRSETFSRGTNVAVFHGNVQISDARGQMTCQMVTVVTGATNQLVQIIAERDVRIQQQGFTATGARAEYNAATGLVHLTGHPELVSEDKSLRAEMFIINRNANTFSVSPGKYRIQMKMKGAKTSTPISFKP